MSSKLLFSVIATLIFAGTAHAGCTLPKPPRNIPDGKTATKEEMMSTHEIVQDYNSKVTEYTDCLKREFDEAVAAKGEKITDKEKKAMESRMNEKHNAAMDKLQAVADRFNEQVRAFNAKNGVSPPAKSDSATTN